MSKPRLSHEIKQAILAEVRAGEKHAAIAAKFGVHFTYPSLLAKRAATRRTSKRYQPTSVEARHENP